MRATVFDSASVMRQRGSIIESGERTLPGSDLAPTGSGLTSVLAESRQDCKRPGAMQLPGKTGAFKTG